MAGETPITVVGNLTADPELRFSPSGAAVANFTVAATPRVKDGDQWKDGETWFVRCSIWREAAESLVESLHKGDRVIVTGRLVSRSWEKDGEKRSAVELQAEDVGPSLKYATAKVVRAAKGTRTGERFESQPQQADPWGNTEAPPF